MNSIKIYLKDIGETNLSIGKVEPILSTHYDQAPITYEIWRDCKVEKTGELLDVFAIPKHTPWIDEKILQSSEIVKSIINYTQEDNKIVEVYHISEDYIISKLYDGWYPCIIKSSVNFFGENIFKERSDSKPIIVRSARHR